MMPIAEIIRLSWSTYASKIKNYLPFIGLIFVFSAINGLASDLLMESLPVPFGRIASILVSLLMYLLNFGVTVLIILITSRFLENKKADFKIKDALAVYWPALAISVLVGLITIGGFLLLFVPGILFTIWYAFSVYLAVLEKKRNIGALLHESREMSRGRFWPIFWRLLLPSVFWAIIAYLVLAGIFNLLGIVFNQSFASQTGLPAPLAIASIFIANLVAAFFSALPLITMTIVYKEAKK